MNTMMKAGLAIAAGMLCAQLAVAEDAKTPEAKRAELRKMCDDSLATLYKAKPELKVKVAAAAGYGCFTSFGMSFFVGGAGGQGLVHENGKNHDVYMKMGQASGGLDFGVKKYREVMVFWNAKTMEQFVTKGWEVGGSAEATATAKGKGGTTEQNASTSESLEIFPISDTGLAIGVAAAARKYWKDDELNAMK
jgi:lipid-binding SYLF domain-containing protein